MYSNKKILLYSLPYKGLQRFRKYFISLVILTAIILLGYYFYQLKSGQSEFNTGLLFVYFLFPVFAYWDAKNKKKFFIQIQPDKLVFKNNMWIKQHMIPIENIRFIEINFTDIYIVTNDQKSFKLDIGYMQHSDMRDVKQELKIFRMKAYDLVRPKG